ncbi:MAG TPA: DUF4402 domain-containing protein [Sphingomicrobium sp.]|nr:DUF4402 domain-containing protein [Sphingomicrobium sp.]
MMDRVRVLFAMLALVAGPVAAPGRAAAQCRLCTNPTLETDAETGTPIALEVEASLNFDRLVLTGPNGGTASLAADGSRSVSGAITELSSRAMVGSAVIRGEPGRMVRISLPSRIDMYGLNGNRISIDGIESDVPASARLDSSGSLSFRFGGRLQIIGDADGDYRGDVPITVEYL